MSRTWDEVSARAGRNDMPYLLFTNWWDLDEDEQRKGLARAWTMCEWPMRAAARSLWVMAFTEAVRFGGWLDDDGQVQQMVHEPDVLTVFRGCAPGYERGMAWTTDVDRAHWFATRLGPLGGSGKQGVVVALQVRQEEVLARFVDRGEHEVIIDPTGIEDNQMWQVAKVEDLPDDEYDRDEENED